MGRGYPQGIERLTSDKEVDGSNSHGAYSTNPRLALGTVIVTKSPRNATDSTT